MAGSVGKYTPNAPSSTQSLGSFINQQSSKPQQGAAATSKATHPPQTSPFAGQKVQIAAQAKAPPATTTSANGRERAFASANLAPKDLSGTKATGGEIFQLSDTIAKLGFRRGGTTPILDKEITFKSADGSVQTSSIKDIMLKNLRENLGDNITEEQLDTYITAGDRLINEIISEHKGNFGEETAIAFKSMAQRGKQEQFKPTLECVRAISWFLQAKALSDNHAAGATRPLALLTTESGAMFARDPGNKIFNFMTACAETYNRESSHVSERNPEPKQRHGDLAPNQANLSLLTSYLKQGPISKGIDDPGGKMPGAGSTLLFTRMTEKIPTPGQEQLFLKWEPYGISPWDKTDQNDTFGVGATGRNDKATRAGNVAEGIKHSAEFMGGAVDKMKEKASKKLHDLVGKDYTAPEKNYRGEKLGSGAGKVFSDDFEALLKDGCAYPKETVKSMTKEVGRYGAAELNTKLTSIMADSRTSPQARQEAGRIQTGLRTWMNEMGPDLGMSRKGAEIHVNPYR